MNVNNWHELLLLLFRCNMCVVNWIQKDLKEMNQIYMESDKEDKCHTLKMESPHHEI